jgi:hypothetical protein
VLDVGSTGRPCGTVFDVESTGRPCGTVLDVGSTGRPSGTVFDGYRLLLEIVMVTKPLNV